LATNPAKYQDILEFMFEFSTRDTFGRDMAAWLGRRWTGATLGELGPAFGLTGTDSVSNLVRRAQQRFKGPASWRKRASKIETSLHLNTECNS
jgi:hypothetical protein